MIYLKKLQNDITIIYTYIYIYFKKEILVPIYGNLKYKIRKKKWYVKYFLKKINLRKYLI